MGTVSSSVRGAWCCAKAEWGDLAAMHAVLSHPVATRYWSTPPQRTLAETDAWLGSMIAAAGTTS